MACSLFLLPFTRLQARSRIHADKGRVGGGVKIKVKATSPPLLAKEGLKRQVKTLRVQGSVLADSNMN